MSFFLTITHVAVSVLAVCVSGCASGESVRYPDNWPRTALAASCGPMTGIYVNSAHEKTTRSNAFLSSLLREGLDVSSDSDSNEFLVRFDAEKRTIDTNSDGAWAVSQSLMKGHWTCEPAGVLSATFDRDAPSEGSVGNRVKISVQLYATDNCFLVAHQIVTFYSGFPTGGRREAWFLFKKDIARR